MRRIATGLIFLASALIVNAQNSTFNIYFKQDFEDDTPGLYNYNEWQQDWNSPAYANGLDKTYILRDATGNKVMQWNYPAGSVGPNQGGGQFEAPFNNQVDEVYFSYNIKFKPGFEWVLGGKLPGLTGGPHSYYPGTPPAWDDGFSNGLMWGHGYAGQDDIGGIYFYTYHQDMPGGYGQSFRWGNFKFQVDQERWYNITIRMVMNTVNSDGSGGNYDGIMEGFVDGKLVASYTGLRFRNLSSIHIDKMKIYSHYGGSGPEYAPLRDEWSEIDDVCLFTYAGGVSVPRGHTPSQPGRVLTLPYPKNGVSAPAGTAPAAPSGLAVTASDASSVSLQWTDNANDEDGYYLERSTSSTSGFSRIANLPSNSTSFRDAGLTSGTKYYYRLSSYNAYGNSSWTGPVSVTTSTASSSTSPSAANGDMLACWLLDSNGNDESGKNHNLSFYNGAGFTSDFKQGTSALLLDGTDDYASCQPIDLGSTFTVGMWVKIPSGRSNIQTMLANGTSGSTSNGFKLMVNTYGTSDAKIAFESGDGSVSAVTRSTSGVFEFGTWNYVAVTVDKASGVVKLYYNGSDVTYQSGSHKSFKSNDILKLGTMTNDIFDMKGEIDHVDILGRVLSSSEIQDLMLAKEPVTVTAPSSLKATSRDGVVNLTWNDNSDNETGFVLERSMNDTTAFTAIKTLNANQVSFTDNQVSINGSYFYRLKAFVDAVESDYSNAASIQVLPPPPAAPSNLMTGNASLNSMQLTWIDNAEYEEGFYIERSTDPAAGFSQIAKLGPNTITYSDQSLTESTTYYYRVSAWNSAGSSNWSPVATGTTATPAPPVSQPGMIAYWPVEYNGKDLSGNGHDLSMYNGIQYSADRKIGSASLTLDGTDDHAASPSMDPGNTFTITTWVKIPSGESNIQTIIANGASGSTSDGFKVMVNTYGTSDAKIAFESGDGSVSAVTRSDAGIFTFGLWNHLAITVDRTSGSVKLYLNGNDVTYTRGSHTRFKTSGPIWLGSMTNSNFPMRGQLDDIRLYNKVLSASEIQASMSEIIILPAPSELSAGNITYQSADLSWTDNAGNETGYELERSADSLSGFTKISDLGADVVSYSDINLAENTTYYYRVRAVTANENSAWSPVLAVTTKEKPVTANDMFAYWPMDNSSVDETGHGYDLTLYNGPKFNSDSKQGSSSLGFDGINDFTASPVMDLGSEFTISLWVNVPKGRSNIQTLVANSPSGSQSNGFKLMVNTYGTTDQKIIFETGNGSSSASTRSNTGVFVFGRWNHVAVTVNKNTGTVHLYYNGTDVTYQANSHTSFNTYASLRLATMTNNIFTSKGLFDDVRLYTRELSGDEVKSAMNSASQSTLKAAGNTATSVDRDNFTPELNFVTYPNPFINTLNISNAGNIDHVELIDLSGKILRSLSVHGESVCTINTENLPSGVYLVKVTGKNNFVKIQKVIRY